MFRQKSVLYLLFAVALVIAAACSSTPEPTATPVPPTPTPEPPKIILADPVTETLQFLDALPDSESDCALQAVGGIDRAIALLQQDHDTEPLTPSEIETVGACISQDTVRRVIVGQLDREAGGLSDQTVNCIAEQTAGLSAAALFTSEPGIDSSISLIKGIFCLNAEERAEVSAGDNAYGFSDLGGIDALECVVNGAGPTGLEGLMGALSGSGSANEFETISELFPIMVECGAIDDSNFEESGVSAAQIMCIMNELGEDSLAVLEPDAELDGEAFTAALAAFALCGLDIAELMGEAALPVDPDSSDDPVDPGTDDPDGAMDEPPTSLDEIDLPFTPAEIACLMEELGEEQVADLLTGGAPDLSLFAALGACEIDIASLLTP